MPSPLLEAMPGIWSKLGGGGGMVGGTGESYQVHGGIWQVHRVGEIGGSAEAVVQLGVRELEG